jgi:hypothetical protein
LRDNAAADAHSPAVSLDHSPLGDAIGQLEKALAYAHSDLARNDSSHTCNQAKAEQVFALSPGWL